MANLNVVGKTSMQSITQPLPDITYRKYNDPKGQLLCFVDVRFGSLILKGLRVLKGTKGNWVAWPQTADKDGKYIDNFTPNADVKKIISDAILKKVKNFSEIGVNPPTAITDIKAHPYQGKAGLYGFADAVISGIHCPGISIYADKNNDLHCRYPGKPRIDKATGQHAVDEKGNWLMNYYFQPASKQAAAAINEAIGNAIVAAYDAAPNQTAAQPAVQPATQSAGQYGITSDEDPF